MKETVKEIVKRWSSEGMRWPFLHDPESGKPSVTLMMFYIASVLVSVVVAVTSTLMIIKGDYLSSAMSPILVWTMAYVFYRMRKLDKFKIDLDDKTIELEGDNSDDKNDSDSEGSGQSS